MINKSTSILITAGITIAFIFAAMIIVPQIISQNYVYNVVENAKTARTYTVNNEKYFVLPKYDDNNDSITFTIKNKNVYYFMDGNKYTYSSINKSTLQTDVNYMIKKLNTL